MPFIVEQSETPQIIVNQTTNYFITLDILPDESSGDYQRPMVELKINGAEVRLKRAEFNFDANSVGVSCSFTLWDLADKSLVNNSAVIDYRIGKIINGVEVWKVIANGQKLSGTNWELRGDTFSFSSISGLTEKLLKSPATDVMIYNPAKSPFSADEVEPRYDNAGNPYEVEAISVSNLTLHQLFDEIFVERCGFSDVQTDIDDFALKQASFPMGVPLYEGVKPLIGIYRPMFEEIGDVLHIRDSTLALPAGYPTPPDLTFEFCRDLSLNSTETTADAVDLTYDASAQDAHIQEADWTITNEQYTEESTGDTIELERWILILRNRDILMPTIVLEEFRHDFLRRHYRGNTLIKFERISLSWDKYSRVTVIRQETDELVPDLENPGEFIWKEYVSVERHETTYAQHPHTIDRQFIQKTIRQRKGLLVVDADNPYEWNKTANEFTQAYEEAAIAGNIRSGMTYRENQSLKTYTELFEPKRDGTVFYSRRAFDHVANKPRNNLDEPRTGEIGLDGTGSFGQPKTLIVLPAGETTKGNGTVLELNSGPLPLKQAIPVSRRILSNLQEANLRASFQIDGLNLAVRRGYICLARDKANNALGVFMVEGYSAVSAVNPDGTQSHSTQVEAVQLATIDDIEIYNYSLSVSSGGSIIIPRSIACLDGYELTSETVADVTVEGRQGTSGAWTNLETSSIDLSPWAGTTEDFQIRLTAGTVTAITYKNFKLTVAPI